MELATDAQCHGTSAQRPFRCEIRSLPVANGLVAPISAAAVSASATAATTTTATLAGLGFVHRERTTILLRVVQAIDSCLRFGIGTHLNKAEAFAATSITICHNLGTANLAELAKQFFQFSGGHFVAKVSAIEFLTQRSSPNKLEHGNGNDCQARKNGVDTATYQAGRAKERKGPALDAGSVSTIDGPTATQYSEFRLHSIVLQIAALRATRVNG